MQRQNNRAIGQLRHVTFEINIAPHASSSVLVSFGNTRIITAVTIENDVPRWMKNSKNPIGGWLSAEYQMLPYSTLTRKNRSTSQGKVDGRSVEIQRLIGRSLRNCIDFQKLGARTLRVDCDVLQADGGTRTAAITGSAVALALACEQLVTEGSLDQSPFQYLIAAISLGVIDDQVVIDLDYKEDSQACVDLNLVMNEHLEFIEIQGSAEKKPFSKKQLQNIIDLGSTAIAELVELQKRAITTNS